MYELDKTHREIAAETGVSAGSISGIIKRYNGQQSARSHRRAGRPQKLGERDKRLLFRIIRQDPFIEAEELLKAASLSVSKATLIRFLKKEGIHHRKALRRPLLTEETAKKRLEFAQAYENEDPSFWRRWIFSDETTIARGDGKRQQWVFCKWVYFSWSLSNLILIDS